MWSIYLYLYFSAKTIAQQFAVILINGINLHAGANALKLLIVQLKGFLTSKVVPASVIQENAHKNNTIGMQEDVIVWKLFGERYNLRKNNYAKKMQVYNAYKESGKIVDAIQKNDLIIEYI